MKKIIALTILVLLPLIAYAGEKAQEKNPAINNIETGRTAAPMVENHGGGELKPNEYEVISTNGSITRAICPYTCAMRGLAAKHCKTWRSLSNPKLCYVQDTRLKSDAIDWGGSYQGK